VLAGNALKIRLKKTARTFIRQPYVGIALSCLAVVYSVVGLKSIDSSAARDFRTYYAIAEVLSAGRDPYSVDALKPFRVGVTRATDPPTFVLCIKPLAHIAFTYGFWIWTAVSVALFVFALISLSSRSNPRWVFIAHPPVLSNIVLGQSKIAILALLVLTIDYAEREEHGVAGASLALAALWRLFPALLLAYFALQKQWRVVVWTAVWATVGIALTIALLGLRSIAGFLGALPALADPRWQTHENQFGLASVVYRNTNSYMLAAIGPVIILALTIKKTRGKDREWNLLSLWIVTALALLPVLWSYDLVILLIPFDCLIKNGGSIAIRCGQLLGSRCPNLAISLRRGSTREEVYRFFVPAHRQISMAGPGHGVSRFVLARPRNGSLRWAERERTVAR
jgi:hypothetical protein